MPRPESADSHDPFQAFLHRVTRPIEFAGRDAYAHLLAVSNLKRFVSQQVIGTLGERVYPRALETELIALRNLFVDFHTRLTPLEQQDRLTKALALLSRLQGDARAVSQPVGSPKEKQVQPLPVRSSPARPLWELSIQYAKGVGP